MINPIDKIRRLMAERSLDAVLLHTRANFAWATGGKDNHIVQASEYGVADLIVFGDQVVCVTPRMERKRIAEEELADTHRGVALRRRHLGRPYLSSPRDMGAVAGQVSGGGYLAGAVYPCFRHQWRYLPAARFRSVRIPPPRLRRPDPPPVSVEKSGLPGTAEPCYN